MGILLALALGVLLAYANGANDVSKGIATLVGSGVTDYRRAVRWGTLWTAIGALLGGVLGAAMLATFGRGLLNPAITPSLAAALATLCGAAGWVLLATRTGLPVSTTHALVGAFVGVGCVAYGPAAVQWNALGTKVLLPLLISPILAFALTTVLLRVLKGQGRDALAADCVCVEAIPEVHAPDGAAAAPPMSVALSVRIGAQEQCLLEEPRAARLTLDHLHWLTSGATSLARAMNDAPKMVALVAAAAVLGGPATLPMPVLFALVGLGMLIGSLVGGRRVTHVLAEKVTSMDHREGFAANLITAVLVTSGAVYGLPMSTTHVSSGGIVGAGVQRNTLDYRILRDIVLAWVVTLPIAALASMTAYAVLHTLLP